MPVPHTSRTLRCVGLARLGCIEITIKLAGTPGLLSKRFYLTHKSNDVCSAYTFAKNAMWGTRRYA
jgi:hypothetical protein